MFTFGLSSFVKFVLRPFSTSEIINKNRKKKINGTVRHHASFLPVVKCTCTAGLITARCQCVSGHVVRKSLPALRLGNVIKMH